MGTTWSVKIADLPEATTPDTVREHVEALLARINATMSTYDEGSELSRFNRSRETGWVPISPELHAVLAEALAVSRLTDGAFDVTVGPLVNLWGFGPGGGAGPVPAEEDLARARVRVGYRRLELRAAPAAVRKLRGDVYVDLSAIAKGYAVDRVAETLEALGARRYLVDIGGELRGRGERPGGGPWTVAVEQPSPGGRTAAHVLELRDRAIATSGDYRNFFEHEGTRYSHAIDPATGWPVRHALGSVSVLHRSAMRADALATALLVMGPDAGARLARRETLAVLFLVRVGDTFEPRPTAGFERHLAR